MISLSKFTEQILSPVAEQNFRIPRYEYKTFLLVRMKKWVMNVCLPTYNTVRKFFNRHEFTFDRRSCLTAPVQVVHTGTDLQPTREVLGFDSHHVLAPRLASAMPGLRNWTFKATIVPCSTAEMHITQVVSFINIRLQISVYRKWASRLKILILYSQIFYRTKFLSSRKRRNLPLFWPCLDVAHTRTYIKETRC